jgi:uncharacterized protein YndB with AHSA1/START domain
MSGKTPKTRTIQSEIEIDAPIEAVWKALTEAEGLTRWLCDEARVTPGVGGSFWVSWGEGQAGESRIEVWEPGRRLAMRNLPPEGHGQSDEKAAAETPMIQEYILETRAGKTVLRLVDSGIPDSPEWDGMYDGKSRGWKMFFQALRHYLQKHPGKPRTSISEMRPIQGGLVEAWEKFTGPQGLAATGSFAGLSEGARYSVTMPTGEKLEGEVLINMPPKSLSITIENMNDALLYGTFEEMGGTTFFFFSMSAFGLEPGAEVELRERWSGRLQKLFPAL